MATEGGTEPGALSDETESTVWSEGLCGGEKLECSYGWEEENVFKIDRVDD